MRSSFTCQNYKDLKKSKFALLFIHLFVTFYLLAVAIKKKVRMNDYWPRQTVCASNPFYFNSFEDEKYVP